MKKTKASEALKKANKPLSDQDVFNAIVKGAASGNAPLVQAGINRVDLNKPTPMGDNLLTETLLGYWQNLIETDGKEPEGRDYPETVSIITHSAQVCGGSFDLSTPNPAGADALVIARDLKEAFPTRGTDRVLKMIQRAVEKQMAFHGIASTAGVRKPAAKTGGVLPAPKS